MTSAINGKYILEREVGRGASGSVWVARDVTLGRHVAIKLLRRDCENDPAKTALFLREARTVAQLKSEHVVHVYDAGVYESTPYIVMELLEGESLQDRLARQKRLPLRLVARIITDVARGLAATHRQGIVHRDLKPANVYIARQQGGEVSKLLDFGISVFRPRTDGAGAASDRISLGAGTPHYMSPEQISGRDLDHRADVWALGIVAYQMLTGTFPYDAETVSELRARICSGRREPPSHVVGLDARIDALFGRAFAANPEERFQSATDFATELLALSESASAPLTRVLFIDDEPDMEFLVRQTFKRELREGRFEFHFALNGAAGLDQLRQHPDIDVVFTDLNMPRMDGLTFLRRVPEVNPLVRVVVISAYGDMSNIRAAMNLGAFDFLVKPIDFEDLERTMAKCASGASSARNSLRAREENGILRALVGLESVDRLVTTLRAARSLAEESFEGSVVFVRIHGFDSLPAHDSPSAVFDHLNAHFDLFGPDILAAGGVVSRFISTALQAVFRGAGHLTRALEASLAIRERMLARQADCNGTVGGAAIGVDTGTLMAGGTGSIELGRIEQTLIGQPIMTAGRLVILAGSNEILVSAGAQSLVSTDFQWEPYGVDGDGSVPIFRMVARGRSETGTDVLSEALSPDTKPSGKESLVRLS